MSQTPLAATAPAGEEARANRLPDKLLSPLAFVAFLVFWEAAVWALGVKKFVLPAPSDVVKIFVSDLTSGLIVRHFGITLTEVLGGFALAAVVGILLGTVIALIPVVNRAVYPLILTFQTIPKVAIAPLFLIWFGYGIQSKIITVATIAFFPILVNIIVGLSTVDARRILLMRALRAGPFKTYLKVRLPSMLPYLFAGLEVAIVFSVTGAIVGEFIGASVGLGALIIQRQAAIDVAGVFSVLVYMAVMGLGLHAILKMIGQRFTGWANTETIINT
jgi:NitT/TauT family transport system permease protein